jgi:hypothetical protein
MLPRNMSVIAAVMLTLLAGCASPPPTSSTQPTGETTDGQQPPGFAQLTDIPMPARASIDLARTLILGSEDGWVGRVALSTRTPMNDMYDFYEREMLRFGWRKLTSVRSSISVLTYARDKRIATIALQSGTIIGSNIDVTVSPAGGGAPGGGTGGGITSGPIGVPRT